MSATMVKFPKASAGQDISVRAYVKNGSTYTYSENVVVRNLAEIALGAKKLNTVGTFIDEVVDYVDENYKGMFIGFDGAVNLSSAIYEINPKNLEKEFINDWNNLFGTAWTDFDYKKFNSSAIEGSTPLTADTDINCSGTNAYTFFNSNSATSAKWKWLLEFFLGETSTAIHPTVQINAILGNGSYELSSDGTTFTKLYQLKHLSRSLQNFFKANGENINDYPSISFDDSHAISQIDKYNNVIWAKEPVIVKENSLVNLNELSQAGYTFDGYVLNGQDPIKSFVVNNDSVSLIPHYTVIDYEVTFMNGNEKLDLQMTYTTMDDYYLPSLNVNGYDFLGWYDNAECSGDEITTIPVGSTGNKTFYAKLAVQTYANVNVTFDANGGSFNPSLNSVPGDYKFDVEKYVSGGYDAGVTYMLPYITPSNVVSTLQYQNKILLNYNSSLNLYEVVAVDAAKKSLADAAGGKSWTHAIANSAVNITENIAVGQYIYLNKDALSSGPQVAKIFKDLKSLNKFTTVLKEPTCLPTPSNKEEVFTGWKSSLDGSIVYDFPGYMSQPGDITYTAQWGADLEAVFDYNGGVSEELYNVNGNVLGSLSLSVHNDNAHYADLMNSNIFIYKADNVFNSDYSYRYCITKNSNTGLYEVTHFIDKLASDKTIPSETDFVIVISTGYNGTYDDNFDRSKVSVGNIVLFDKDFTTASSSNLVTVKFVDKTITNEIVTTNLNSSSILPTPYRQNFTFLGWFDENDNLIESVKDLESVSSVSLIAKWFNPNDTNSTVTFDFNGGATDELYKKKGTKVSTLVVSKYNSTDFWNTTTTPYKDNVFVNSSGSDPKATFSTRIYIAKDNNSGLYKVVNILLSGTTSTWPVDADLVITLSGQYSGAYDDNFDVSKIKVGDVLFTDKAITTASPSNVVTISFYSATIANDIITEVINSSSKLPVPYKLGYAFGGWYDENGKLYDSYEDFANIDQITVTASWVIDDRIIGSFEDNSWVKVGSTIKLNYEYLGGSNLPVEWLSKTPSIAEVDQYGQVTGLKEGLAEIVVNAKGSQSISFTYYVTVVTDASGMLKVLLDSNNEEIFIRNDLGIGAGTPAYYYDAVGSVSKLLFENYVEHKDYYVSSPSNKTTLTGSGKGGVDFITVHYAADMPYSATYSKKGGSNLASMNKTYNSNGTAASWNYSVGNDGVWYCQNVAYGSWHAGSSKAMSWTSTGLTASQIGTDVYTTDVTLGKDGYFYIKGHKTSVKNTTGYTRLNTHGLGVKLSGSTWYLGGFYYNTSYKYISSKGGNNNSIGMETSVREGSDLWLTWQYTAQLCAKLLIQFDLPIQRLVGHHFFSGKDCPQPLIANNNEIWFEFRDMVAQQMAYFNAYGSAGAAPTLSTNSTYFNNKGRVTSLPTYSTCQTYTLTYKDGSSTKTVTLSTIIPGTVA